MPPARSAVNRVQSSLSHHKNHTHSYWRTAVSVSWVEAVTEDCRSAESACCYPCTCYRFISASHLLGSNYLVISAVALGGKLSRPAPVCQSSYCNWHIFM